MVRGQHQGHGGPSKIQRVHTWLPMSWLFEPREKPRDMPRVNRVTKILASA